MPGKRPKPEEIVSKLRQVEVLQSQGKTAAEAIRSIGVIVFRCYREGWCELPPQLGPGSCGRQILNTTA
jgi:putative transposase